MCLLSKGQLFKQREEKWSQKLALAHTPCLEEDASSLPIFKVHR